MKLEEVKDTIIQMRNEGYGYKRIAKALGANPGSVQRWIAKLGLPTMLETNNPDTPRGVQCIECGKVISTTRFNTTYCSDACRLRVRKIKVNGRKKCVRCNSFIYGLQNVSHCSEDCRHKQALANRTIRLVVNQCVKCGGKVLARRRNNYCSNVCRKEQSRERDKLRSRMIVRPKHNVKCKECGKFFETTRTKAKYCGNACSNRYSNRNGELIRRTRILANGEVDWSISIERLTKRDGKKCYLCGELMSYEEDYNHDKYPSIEHIKPISKGGTHTWGNVKLAHRLCNSKKHNKWEEDFFESPPQPITL